MVPIGVITDNSTATALDCEPASARPSRKPATRPMRTRVVSDTARIVSRIVDAAPRG